MVADTGLTRVADPESIFLILRVRKRIAIEKNKQRLLISTLLFQLLITKFHTAKSSEQRCIVTNKRASDILREKVSIMCAHAPNFWKKQRIIFRTGYSFMQYDAR